MRIHILGVCGTFMAGLARLCRESGWDVTGSDQQVYPPMSDQLKQAGIGLHEGYDPSVLNQPLDAVVIGNAMSRGNPVVEAVLNRKIPFMSGPELLGQLTAGRTVLAVAGTHGKTTTASCLAWILEMTGLKPGFLIGGVPSNFAVSARLGEGDLFVVEADEYDTAFFDKRSKFVHYHPDVFGINNLEFDHADIFADLAAIETQFHHGIRRVPGCGTVVVRNEVPAIERVLSRGLWSPLVRVGRGTRLALKAAGDRLHHEQTGASISWHLRGQHNAENVELALAMAEAVGVSPETGLTAVSGFEGVARRLKCLFESEALRVWDDFAHHPTAIAATLRAVTETAPDRKVTAVIELASNTMKQGVHASVLAEAAHLADRVMWLLPRETSWNPDLLLRADGSASVHRSGDDLLTTLLASDPGEWVLMSNGGFSGLQIRVVDALEAR